MRHPSRPSVLEPHVRHDDPREPIRLPMCGGPDRASASGASEPAHRPARWRLRTGIKAGPMGSPLLSPR
jgi:hypothetical protein